MGNLFWKMFVGAWLTAMIMVISTIYVTHMREFGDPRQEDRWEGTELVRELTHNLRRTRRHGVDHLRHWLERQPADVQARIFAVDSNGDEMLGRALPDGISPLLENLQWRDREKYALINGKPTLGFFIPTRDRNVLRVAFVAGRSKQELLLRFLWRNFWPILLVSMLASGAVCYWLARYLSNPLQELRAATRRVAAGEFDYRVSPMISRRSDELAELATDFDSMTGQLQASMEEQRRLIKDVSHELRSPLARLQVALGIARQKNVASLDPELEKIGKAADYLEDIISDILSLPVAGGDTRPLDDVVELNSLVDAARTELSAEAAERDVNIHVTHSGSEELVATRGSSLTAVMENVLRNAIKYSPANSAVRVELTHLGQDGKQVGNRCRVRVSDSGNGVSETELQAIFRPFYRTDDARTRESGGIGLGLAIAQRTIMQHGGNITARNLKQGGLCVEITLPCIDGLGEDDT